MKIICNSILKIQKETSFLTPRNHQYTGKDRPVVDWPTRLKIALGSAKGLAYLHEDCKLSYTCNFILLLHL